MDNEPGVLQHGLCPGTGTGWRPPSEKLALRVQKKGLCRVVQAYQWLPWDPLGSEGTRAQSWWAQKPHLCPRAFRTWGHGKTHRKEAWKPATRLLVCSDKETSLEHLLSAGGQRPHSGNAIAHRPWHLMARCPSCCHCRVRPPRRPAVPTRVQALTARRVLQVPWGPGWGWTEG